MSAAKSRLPLPVNDAMERMNLPPLASTPVASGPDGSVREYVLQDYRPISQSLEWKIAEAHWNQLGLLPFVESDVPFLVNNSGRLSQDAAMLLFEHCLESDPVSPTFSVLEVGAGTGLFARYFLDFFYALCAQNQKSYYDRLTYVVTDKSPATVTQWEERGLFHGHKEHIVASVFDPIGVDAALPATTHLRAFFCNYVFDVMPTSIVRAGKEGAEQLCVRTYLATDLAYVAQYTKRTPQEIATIAASENPADLLELVPLLPLLEFDTAFRPIPDGSVPCWKEALEFGTGLDKVLVNHGALETLERFLGNMPPEGFVLINDYGPTQREQVQNFCSLQRFGPTVACAINFPLLEWLCEKRKIITTKAVGDERRGIQARLLSRAELPKTRAEFCKAFSQEAHAYYEGPLELARTHANAGRLHEALDAYREAVTRSPRNWYIIGEAAEFLCLQLKNFDAGLELLRTALGLNPVYSPWLWNVLGDCLYCLERYEDAHEAYLQAARIDPQDVRTNLNLAYTLALFGRLPEALEVIARGLSRDTREAYRARLLEKQRHVLTLMSNRWLREQEQLLRRLNRFHAA